MAQTRRGSWWHKGLVLRVTGDRIRARINERSRYSQTPTLVGRLVAAPDGTRVVGTIRWTLQLVNIVFMAGACLLCLWFGLDVLRSDDEVTGLLLVVFGLFFGALSGVFVYFFHAEREHETARLAEEIRLTFAKRR